MYKDFGEAGLRRSRSKKVYSFQLSLDGLNFKKQASASYQDTAIEFNIHEPSIIVNWYITFLKKGIEELEPKPKGRPSMSKKKPRNTIRT